MRVLVVNKFLHHVGGVETYLSWLAVNLRAQGHAVRFFGMEPPPGSEVLGEIGDEYDTCRYRDYHGPVLMKMTSAAASIYSPHVGASLRRAITDFRPDVVHFHMTCRQLTPVVARVVRSMGVASVSTAHEYKAVCANQRLWDDAAGSECYACLNASLAERMTNIVSRRCVKGGLGSSLLAAAELPVNDYFWARSRSVIHAPSRYMAEKLSASPSVSGPIRYLDLSWGVESTVRTSRALPGNPSEAPMQVVFIGRLAPEKGVDVLLRAWPIVKAAVPAARLDVYGSGAESGALQTLSNELKLRDVHFRGRYEIDGLSGILEKASLTVHPSVWAENSPYTVRESLQHGVPAVVSRHGGLPEMVPVDAGYVYESDTAPSLGEAIVTGLRDNLARTERLRAVVAKRAVSDEQHLMGLNAIYREAVEVARRRS
ncbi:glycosyltransferase [Rhodococcoides corynebacterioides]|uniref:glycosyltransferase n=1 Tax=Rhodococcoides corynebacterioides TaxID=53972 RepID=UPI001C9B2309|nr:glycosyltransferase [Rhodococcus corynebacterioides]MBY6361525.1 glycosyltransferase [Rhodococcus corynebacterioides]